MNFWQNIPLFTIILSLLCAVISSVIPAKAARRLYSISGPVTIAATGVLFGYVWNRHEVFTYTMGHFPAPWGNELSIGPLEALLALAFCVILYLSVFGGLPRLHRDVIETKRNLYFVLVQLVQVSLLALLYTNDVFTAYVFVEISTLASCGLLMIRQIGRTTAAATRYMIFSLLGSGLFLIGIILLYSMTGHLLIPNIKQVIPALAESSRYQGPFVVSLALITLGLAIKSGCFPFHFWMPDTYGCATPSASAILSGLISKGYILVLIKFIYRVVGLDIYMKMGISGALFIFGIAGMIAGSLSAVRENDLNRMIAFSSAAQIGYIYMGIGLGTIAGMEAAVFHILTHAFTKPLLFLSAARLEDVSGGSYRFSALSGAGHRNRMAAIAFTIGSLSMIGIPGLMGFISKLLFALSSMTSPNKIVLTLAALVISTLLNTLYFFRTVIRIYTPTPNSPYRDETKHIKDQWRFILTGAMFVGINLFFGLHSQPITDMLSQGLSLFR